MTAPSHRPGVVVVARCDPSRDHDGSRGVGRHIIRGQVAIPPGIMTARAEYPRPLVTHVTIPPGIMTACCLATQQATGPRCDPSRDHDGAWIRGYEAGRATSCDPSRDHDGAINDVQARVVCALRSLQGS